MSVVGAVKSCAVAEDDVEGPFPPLGGQVELVHSERVRDRYVGAAVHYSWFVGCGAHAGSDGCCELGGWAFFFISFE